LYIVDSARAIDHVLQCSANLTAQRVFNVIGENYQKQGPVELARRNFPDVKIVVTDKNPDLRNYRVDGSRIMRELGFKPLYTVEDAFYETDKAVHDGMFREPDWRGHSAIPLDPTALHR
jgi:nucleoside-diphosphate-sugar epimerase